MRIIVIVKRSNDFMAYLKDHKEIWGAGKSVYSAIGNCINAHREIFNIKIIDNTKRCFSLWEWKRELI